MQVFRRRHGRELCCLDFRFQTYGKVWMGLQRRKADMRGPDTIAWHCCVNFCGKLRFELSLALEMD